MVSRQETGISQIKSVPGLFISEYIHLASFLRPPIGFQSSAQSDTLLKFRHITHILSLRDPNSTRPDSPAKNDAPGLKNVLMRKEFEIEDNPSEDILQYLKEVCDWIEIHLASAKENEGGDKSQLGVLVHGTEGISRSGTIVVAYLMRKLSLDYPAALALAQESRPLISPNRGFSYQLRIWKDCDYDVYSTERGPSVPEEKALYKAWKSDRTAFLKGGEVAANQARFASVANLAAAFGKKKELEDMGEEREKRWENVERMEEEWTRRLISGGQAPGTDDEA